MQQTMRAGWLQGAALLALWAAAVPAMSADFRAVGHTVAEVVEIDLDSVRREEQTMLSDEGSRSTATPQAPWRPVGAGSREARELALACRVGLPGSRATGGGRLRSDLVGARHGAG